MISFSLGCDEDFLSKLSIEYGEDSIMSCVLAADHCTIGLDCRWTEVNLEMYKVLVKMLSLQILGISEGHIMVF